MPISILRQNRQNVDRQKKVARDMTNQLDHNGQSIQENVGQESCKHPAWNMMITIELNS